jgi:hypothetical protein
MAGKPVSYVISTNWKEIMKLEFLLTRDDVPKLVPLMDKGYSFIRETVTCYGASEVVEMQRISCEVSSKSHAVEVANVLDTDVNIINVTTITPEPKVVEQVEFTPKKVAGPRNMNAWNDAQQQQRRNLNNFGGSTSTGPTWSYAVRHPVTHKAIASLIWPSKGNCVSCGTFSQTHLVELEEGDLSEKRVVLCSDCATLRAGEGDILLDFGRLDSAVKSLYTTNSTGLPQLQPQYKPDTRKDIDFVFPERTS